MKPSLRILTCALASASVLAAVPAGANPGIQRVTGGPGASAHAQERRADDALAGRQRAHPGAARLRAAGGDDARRARGRLARRPHGRARVRRARTAAGARASWSPRTAEAQAADVPRARSRSTRSAPHGSAIYLTRRSSPTDATRYTVLSYNRADRALNPVVTKVVFSAEGGEKPDGWSMQGQPLSRATAADGALDVHALHVARVPVHPRAAARPGRVGDVHRAPGIVERQGRDAQAPAPARTRRSTSSTRRARSWRPPTSPPRGSR